MLQGCTNNGQWGLLVADFSACGAIAAQGIGAPAPKRRPPRIGQACRVKLQQFFMEQQAKRSSAGSTAGGDPEEKWRRDLPRLLAMGVACQLQQREGTCS